MNARPDLPIFAKAADIGVSWFRTGATWRETETSCGSYNWDLMDATIRESISRGVRPYINLFGTAACYGSSESARPSDPQAFYRFARNAVNRYKNLVDAWGTWNEANLSGFWKGNFAQFRDEILLPATAAVREFDGASKIYGPEFSHHAAITSPHPYNLFYSILACCRSNLDGISLHVYPDAPGGPLSFLDMSVLRVLKMFALQGKKPFWITEWGFNACTECNRDQQAHAYRVMADGRDSRAWWWNKLFPYRIWSGGDCDEAILFTNFSPKYAYDAYKRKVGGLPFIEPSPGCH